jgi:hypothetical protein
MGVLGWVDAGVEESSPTTASAGVGEDGAAVPAWQPQANKTNPKARTVKSFFWSMRGSGAGWI